MDDDVRNIFAMTSVLEQHRMSVLSAENGRDAIELLRGNPAIDIVLMDIMMPEMDGYDTMRAIREHPGVRSPADRRGHGEGDEGRPREVHRGRGLGLPLEAGGLDADALDLPLVAASVGGA